MGAQVYTCVDVRVTVCGGLSIWMRGALGGCVSLCLWARGCAGVWVFRYVGKKAGSTKCVAVRMFRCVRGQEGTQVKLYGCKDVQVDKVWIFNSKVPRYVSKHAGVRCPGVGKRCASVRA